MTVLEMLDVLESEVSDLQAERVRLASELADAERRLKKVTTAPPAKPRKSTKRVAKKDRPEPPENAAKPKPAERSPLGKRMALGRGLAQLRRAVENTTTAS